MAVVTRRDGGDGWSNRAHEEREEGDKEEEKNRRGVGTIRRHTYLYVGSTVLLIIAVGISSVLRAGGDLCAYSARVRSSHRRCLLNVQWAMVGLAVKLFERRFVIPCVTPARRSPFVALLVVECVAYNDARYVPTQAP